MTLLWVKALHLIAMVCWFAGIFYLPRLFVYHAEALDDTSKERFKIMERRLYYGIMIPSMLATLFLGIWLATIAGASLMHQGWFHAKMSLVFLLVGYHHICGAFMRKFASNQNHRSSKFFRIFNEIPVVLLIVIVVLAVLKPF